MIIYSGRDRSLISSSFPLLCSCGFLFEQELRSRKLVWWWKEMHGGGGLLFQYFQDLGIFEETQLHLQEELLRRPSIDAIHDDNGIIIEDGSQTHLSAPVGNPVMSSTISEYDFGGEGDLFKAPEPIIEEPLLELDPVAAANTMMSSGEDIITSEPINVLDIKAFDGRHLQSDVFYECKEDLLDNPVIEEMFSEFLNDKFLESQMEKDQIVQNDDSTAEGPLQKSVSSSCLDSKECNNGVPTGPSCIDFQEMDVESVFGMRRTYSEGDIETLGIGNKDLVNISILHLPVERLLRMDSRKIEERKQKLSRYMNKKTKRNFGRKIKYACRKALADSQPRVRGRFAKTEECETAKPSK